MLEKMVVERVEGGVAILKNMEEAKCDSCPAKSFCRVDPSKNYLRVSSEGLDLNPGDIVVVKTPKAVATRLSFFVYTIPSIIFVLTLVVMKKLNYSDITSFMTSISLIGLYYLFLRRVDKKLKEKFSPKIVEVEKNPPGGGLFLNV